MTETRIDELVNHIKKNLVKGYKEDSIRWALINQGYSRAAVDRALKKASADIEQEKNIKEKARKAAERPKITYQIYDENNKVIYGKKSFWKKVFKK